MTTSAPRPYTIPTSHSTYHVPIPSRRMPPAASSSVSLTFPQSATVHNLNSHGTHLRSSRTWTTSSGELGLMSDTDDLGDRALFVQEYNRLAKKHGVRLLVVDDFKIPKKAKTEQTPERRSWLSRVLRASSTTLTTTPSTSNPPRPKPVGHPVVKPRRSVSDFAQNLVTSLRESPQILDLQAMVRLSGKSVLYLPQDHCPGSLILPTCIRATAQYLAQHTAARGVFRIPGSVRIVTALFDYYCQADKGSMEITGTIRSANLPVHINASVHDVASTFKRLLSVLPGGILGTLSLFDAFVAINSNMQREPEFPRTKQTKVRARLIALAIGTIESQFRRELICAVFSLLSLIGRTAELAPREDDNRRPLPTGDLMGYSALGIVFGPLLVGDLLDTYDMNIATPDSGLLVFPLSSKKLQKRHGGRRKSVALGKKPQEPPAVDKIYIANSITEMLIANWRDIVRQMKALGTHHHKKLASPSAYNSSLRPSVSEYFGARPMPEWDRERKESAVQVNRDSSPEPETPVIGVKRQRPRSQPSVGSNRLQGKTSGTILSPTAEEGSADRVRPRDKIPPRDIQHRLLQKDVNVPTKSRSSPVKALEDRGDPDLHDCSQPSFQNDRRQIEPNPLGSPEVPMEDVPPRTSSKQRCHQDGSTISLVDSTQQGFKSSLDEVRQTGGKHTKTSDTSISQCSAASCSPVWKTREMSPKRQHINTQEFESMTAVPNGSRVNVKTENDHPLRDCSITCSSVSSKGRQQKDKDSMQGEARKPPVATQVNAFEHTRHSINLTPRQFYAPMKVPPNLSGELEGQLHDIWSKRVSSFDSFTQETPQSKVPSSRPISTGGRRAVDSPGLSPKATGLVDHVNKFEPEIRSKSLPLSSHKSVGYGQANIDTQLRGQSIPQTNDSGNGDHRVRVKAMAAMFEDEDEMSKAEAMPSRQKKVGGRANGDRTPSPIKTLRTSKSGSSWGVRSPSKGSLSIKSYDAPPKKSSFTDVNGGRDIPRSRTSIADTVAARAAAITEAERQQQGQSEKRPAFFARKRAETAHAKTDANIPQKAEGNDRGAFNLGTMIPPQEQPPVAQHLTFARPPSSSSSIQSKASDPAEHGSQNPTQRPGSTSSLHAQIRNLQRQLDAKADEISQLRRSLEAQEDADVGTLSEQLREAKREAHMWKERAEAAERRVRVFKRFTAKLKGIRDAAAVADQNRTNYKQRNGRESELDDSHDGNEGSSPGPQVRFIKGQVSDKRASSEDSGHTEDTGVVTARIRKCLHGGPVGADGASSDRTTDVLNLDAPFLSKAEEHITSPRVKELWKVAKEILELEEEN